MATDKQHIRYSCQRWHTSRPNPLCASRTSCGKPEAVAAAVEESAEETSAATAALVVAALGMMAALVVAALGMMAALVAALVAEPTAVMTVFAAQPLTTTGAEAAEAAAAAWQAAHGQRCCKSETARPKRKKRPQRPRARPSSSVVRLAARSTARGRGTRLPGLCGPGSRSRAPQLMWAPPHSNVAHRLPPIVRGAAAAC
eukprot:5424163-Prymnesium_polylepis.1